MRLSPCRESRVPRVADVQDGLGASFVPLSQLYGWSASLERVQDVTTGYTLVSDWQSSR